MVEYIEREAALEAAKKSHLYFDIKPIINAIPAADVRPVVRGKWERMPDNDVFGDIHCKCSACGEDWWQGPGWFRKANFCPNCGAVMEER
jgi:hypothetical protein